MFSKVAWGDTKAVRWSSRGSESRNNTQLHTNSVVCLWWRRANSWVKSPRCLCMFWDSPCLNSLTCSSCSEDILWKVSESALPAFPALEQKIRKCPEECHLNMKFELDLLFFSLLPHIFCCFTLLLLFSLHVTLHSLSPLLHHSFILPHLPYTPSLYPSSLQSASYPRRVAGSFPVSTWPLHSGAGACRGDLRADSPAHPEPRQPGSHGRHQRHRWGWWPNILCCYWKGPTRLSYLCYFIADHVSRCASVCRRMKTAGTIIWFLMKFVCSRFTIQNTVQLHLPFWHFAFIWALTA